MDRSSLYRVETTQDLEKRQAFKTRLANKINFSELKEEQLAVGDTFNGVSPGGRLVHPSLGEGTLVEIDRINNELLVNFDAMGLIGLVLTQATSFVHAPVKKEVGYKDDPFLGEKIERLYPDRSETAYRPVELRPEINRDFSVNETSYLVEGTKVFHKELGNCIILSLNKESNEIVIDSDRHGIINLVLSQVRHAITPINLLKKEAEIHDDPFLGSEILRDGSVKPDAVQRELSTARIISPDFIEPEKKFYPVGSSVWHPDLGSCTVLSVDEGKNSLTLSTSSGATIDMVLSQVRSKLRAVETLAEHVPIKPLVKEALAAKVPQYTSRTDVSVSIPEVFKTWQRNQQFMYLTRNQKLSTEQANDVFSVLDGNDPLFHSVLIVWQSQSETQSRVFEITEIQNTMGEIKIVPNILENDNLWHPDFGECSVTSFNTESNELFLQTSVGIMPFVMDVTLPTLAVITASAPEHAPKQFGSSRVLVTSDTPVTGRPLVKVSIPEVFVTWRTLDQYQYLTGQLHLTPDHANDIIDTMTGKLHSSKTEYEITWTDDLPEANKRAEFKQQLLNRIEQSSAETVVAASPSPVDPGIQRIVEEVVVTKKEVVLKKVSVDLPNDFKQWTASGQYVFLTRTRLLTSTEANDILDSLQGKPINSKIDYEIIWS